MKISRSILLLLTLLAFRAQAADTLDEILRPSRSATTLSSAEADESWKRVVDAFRANDMAAAIKEGNKFLTSNLQASALQVMGVKVMLGLAGGAAAGTTFESREDQAAFQKLDTERADYARRTAELQKVVRDNDAIINRITLNRKRAVQPGTGNYLECVQASKKINVATAEIETFKGSLEKNKLALAELQMKAHARLKPMTLQLLDGLINAGEIDAAVGIANTYVRTIGNDLEVATKQQDILRLQQAAAKAEQVINLLKTEAGPLVARKLYWEASEKVHNFLQKVETMSEDKDLLRMVRVKASLDPVGLKRNLAAGQRSFDLVHAQAELDSNRAAQELILFKQDFPDHPGVKELELFVASVKTKSAAALLEKIDADFENLKKKFDPEKLRLVLNRTMTGTHKTTERGVSRGASQQYSEKVFTEMGLAQADSRLIKSSLQGLSAGLAVLEKAGLSSELEGRHASLKAAVETLSRLLEE